MNELSVESHWPCGLVVTPRVIYTLEGLLHFLMFQLANLSGSGKTLEFDSFDSQVVNFYSQTHPI